jgi:hypothetical protein
MKGFRRREPVSVRVFIFCDPMSQNNDANKWYVQAIRVSGMPFENRNAESIAIYPC